MCAMCESILRAHGLKTGFYSLVVHDITSSNRLMYNFWDMISRVLMICYICCKFNGGCVCYSLQIAPSTGGERENTSKWKASHKVTVCVLLLGVLQLIGWHKS